MKGRGRKVALWLHGWVGITVGAWLAVVGLTGSILVWRPEIEPTFDARQRVAPSSSKPLPLQQDYDAVKQAHPKQKIDRIYVSRAANLAHEFRLRGSGGGDDDDQTLSVFVNPYNGQITGEQTQNQDLFGRVDELHVRLLSGDVGHTLVGVGGGVLLLMALSGLWLWWPRRGAWKRAFVPQLKTNWRGRNYELHRVTGALVCVLLVGEAITGMAFVWSAPTQQLLGTVFPGPKEKKAPKASKGKLLALDTYANAALGQFPGAQISRITFPKKAGAPLVVRLQQTGELNPAGNTFLSFDPVSGKVLKVENSATAASTERLMNIRYPIHTGRWGGTITRILYSLLGLTLPAFYVSGLVLWWHKWRLKRQKRAKAQASAPKVVEKATTASVIR